MIADIQHYEQVPTLTLVENIDETRLTSFPHLAGWVLSNVQFKRRHWLQWCTMCAITYKTNKHQATQFVCSKSAKLASSMRFRSSTFRGSEYVPAIEMHC